MPDQELLRQLKDYIDEALARVEASIEKKTEAAVYRAMGELFEIDLSKPENLREVRTNWRFVEKARRGADARQKWLERVSIAAATAGVTAAVSWAQGVLSGKPPHP